MSGQQDRKTYRLRKRWVWQDNKWKGIVGIVTHHFLAPACREQARAINRHN